MATRHAINRRLALSRTQQSCLRSSKAELCGIVNAVHTAKFGIDGVLANGTRGTLHEQLHRRLDKVITIRT